MKRSNRTQAQSVLQPNLLMSSQTGTKRSFTSKNAEASNPVHFLYLKLLQTLVILLNFNKKNNPFHI